MTTNKMYTVSETDLIDVLNMLTYDYYAHVQRHLWRAGFNRRPFFAEYVAECKKYVALDSIVPEVWYSSYQFIADLFEDNERNGTPCDREAVLKQGIDKVVRTMRQCCR